MMGTKAQIATAVCLASSFLFVTTLAARAEDSTVNIKLTDSSMSGGTMPQNDNMPDMKMVLDHAVVHAGKVTLHATNESKTMTHEVIVFRDTGGLLPYNDEAAKLLEKQMKSLGEVHNVQPGQSGDHTFNLTPGKYLLICNQPQHFKRGMWARLTVVADNAPLASAGTPSTVRPATKQVQIPAGEEDEGS